MLDSSVAVAMSLEHTELVVFAVVGAVVTAFSNGANDIANSMGTSYGAKSLSLRQAILVGALAEFVGALCLGSSVAKTISKGVIEPESFAVECDGPLHFGLAMISVLAGTGSTTLLATLYGLPISASHGVIGGLVAVGVRSHGASSIGARALLATSLAWLMSPLAGLATSAMIHALIHVAVHRAPQPSRRARALQPLMAALTVFVAASFFLVAGASPVEPLAFAIAIAAAIGLTAASLVCAVRGLWPPPPLPQTRCLKDLIVEKRVQATALYEGSRSPNRGGEVDEEAHAEQPEKGSQEKHLGRFEEKRLGAPVRLPPVKRSSTRVLDGIDIGIEMSKGGEAAQVGLLSDEATERVFSPLLILSAVTVAFAHGGNDLGNSIGPLIAVIEALSPAGDITRPPSVPAWALLLGAGAFAAGIVAIGSSVILTVGGKITQLTPSRSFAVQTGTAVSVLVSTAMGLAVSTSHCLVGSVIGVSLVSKVFVFAHPPISPICRTPLFPYLTFYSCF